MSMEDQTNALVALVDDIYAKKKIPLDTQGVLTAFDSPGFLDPNKPRTQALIQAQYSAAEFGRGVMTDIALEAVGLPFVVLSKGDDVYKILSKLDEVAPNSGLVARIQGKLNLYPKVIDPRTGRHIQFPSGIKGPVDKSLRVAWDSKLDRAAFIAEWHRRGYATPRGGWDKFDIHHIQPREFGGTNDFWNLVPVERNTHQELFNEFWREFTGL
jgi:hypothetical protein